MGSNSTARALTTTWPPKLSYELRRTVHAPGNFSRNAIDKSIHKNPNFDFIRDIAPIAITGRTPFVMVVNPSVPAKTVAEFISYAKANPGKINCASSGVGSDNHVFVELFKTMTGVDLVHVPYRASFMPDVRTHADQ